MAQSILQRITTNWNWIKGFSLYPINTFGYSWSHIKPYLKPRTLRKIDKINAELSTLRILIDRDIEAVKRRIKKSK